MTGLPRLTLVELKLFLREPMAVFFSMAFPVLLVVILGLVPVFRTPDPALGGLRVIDVYVPITITFVLAMLALSAMPAVLAGYRERGILRRLATTPVSPAVLLAAQLVMNFLMAVVSVGLVIATGRLAYGVALPRQPAAFVLAFVMGTAALLAVGLVLAAVSPNTRVAQAIGTVLFFPMLFFAGLWVPVQVMPAALRHVSDFTPLGAAVQALQRASSGEWPQPLHVAVMAGYLIVFALIAARSFRWQ